MSNHRRAGLTAVEVTVAVIVLAVCIAVTIPFLKKARDRDIIAANGLLKEAIRVNDLELARTALKQGAEPNSLMFPLPRVGKTVENGKSPLYAAVQLHGQYYRSVLGQRRDYSLTMDGLGGDMTDIIRLLLDEGADIHGVTDYQGVDAVFFGEVGDLPPLRRAIGFDKLDLVKLFLEYGVDVNTVYDGKSLLEWAEVYKSYEIADYLRSQGATERSDD